MRKKLFAMISLCFLTTSFAQAASLHGDFEGNPIVAVKSGGKELNVEDVPAINYRNRTMVPIYLLKQLGADVAWNSDTYSVNVSLPSQAGSLSEEPAMKDHIILKNTYQLLIDLDQSMWMFTDKLQYYANIDNPSEYLPFLNTDYQNLANQYNETLQLALKVLQSGRSNQLGDIIKNETSAMKELTQSKDMLVNMINNGNTLTSSYKITLLSCLRSIQRNIDFTKKIQHDELLQEIDKALK